MDRVNQQVYQPGHKIYQQYAAPSVQQAQELGHQQWEKSVKPQLELAKVQAGKQYDAVLGPYVQKVHDVVDPQIHSLKTSVSDIWELEVEPVYRRTAPYAQKLLTHGRQFAVDTALPQAQYATSAAWSFWIRQVWPKMRVLYGENVEPQLMRITERLGRYRDEKKLEAKVKSIETSSSLTSATSAAAAAASSASSVISEAIMGTSTSIVSASSTPTIDSRIRFQEDLKSWETVCAKAVDEGSEHLRERIDEIAARQHKSQVNGTGYALVTQLEETSLGAISSVKARILSIVGGIPEEPTNEDLESAETSLTQGIRNAGQTVKARAQAVREWRTTFNSQTDELVSKALQSTLETIDNIRELRLTEIGRKYTESQGLTHKDWSQYNDLKKATQVWRNDVERIAQGNAGVAAAKDAAHEVESRGMTEAEGAAKELARLKDVGKWKIVAQDASDDFNSRAMPAAVEKARARVADKMSSASDAVIGSSSPLAATDSIKSVAAEKASQVSEAVVGSSTGSVESFASKASAAVVGGQKPMVESVSSKIASSASSAASVASQAVVGSSSGSLEGFASKASTVVAGSQQPIVESVSSKVAASASSVASVASSSILGSSTGSVESLVSKASTAVAGGESPSINSVQSAVSSGSSKAAASAVSVASDASAAIIGTTSSVSDTLSDMASSVSSAVVGTSTPAVQSHASSISSSLDPSVASILAAGRSQASSVSSSSGSSIGGEIDSSASSIASQASDHASDFIDNAGSSAASASFAAASSISTASEKASTKVWGGAMAQAVPSSSGPILDDVYDDVVEAAEAATDKVQSVADA